MRVKYLLVIVLFPFYSCISSEKPQKDREQSYVSPGAYNLEQYIPLISGKTIGVVANSATLINGTHLVDTLLSIKTDSQKLIKVSTIFSPEHGFSGTFDAGKTVEGEQFGKDEIKIISLYGDKKKPAVGDLKGIEVIVFDLQDVGVRFYTYISTLHYVMQACAENNISLVVLDRPNPHCNYVDGPVLEEEYKSFVGMHPVPVVYGMTIGEYAQMINGEGWIGDNLVCDLKVVPISNFNRNSFYEFPQKPSPNLPNMRAIYLYPSLCFFEGTVLSVGRGTDFPFQVFGHPNYVGASFSFKPKSKPGASLYPKWQDEICYGRDLRNVSFDSLKTIKSLNLSFLLESYSNVKTKKDFFSNYFDILAGTEKFRNDILLGKTAGEIRSNWEDDLIEFKKIRNKYLLYK